METFFNNGSMTMKFHILYVHEGLGGHAKDGQAWKKCRSRNLGSQETDDSGRKFEKDGRKMLY